MDISSLFTNFHVGDVKAKLHALTVLNSQLSTGTTQINTMKNDTRSKLLNAVIDSINDSNTKIVQNALSCTKILIEKYGNFLNSVMNVIYVTLTNKLSDSKIQTREAISDVLISLIKFDGLNSGMEKMLPPLNHKHASVRESVVLIITRLFDIFGDDLGVISELPQKLVVMLNDQQPTVRQASFEALIKLSSVYGEAILDDMATLNTKPSYMNQMRDVLQSGNQVPGLTKTRSAADFKHTLANQSMSTPSHNQKNQSPGRLMKQESSVSKQTVNPSTITLSPSDNQLDKSLLAMIFETPPVSIAAYSNERDVQKHFDAIVAKLSVTEDWQARIQALSNLQSLIIEQHDIMPQLLRGIYDLINVQISDLRSAVCKEAFKAAAVIAIMLGQNFHILSEYWVPNIIKQVAVKIQVISSSADASLRIILASTHIGYHKLIPIFVEQCNGKNAILRKYCLEYLTLVCALWSQEVLDKFLPTLQQIVRVCVMDADQNARKVARQLYWVMANRRPWKAVMNMFLSDMEPIQQKHIHAELNQPTPELQLALKYLQSADMRSSSLAMMIYSTYIGEVRMTAPAPTAIADRENGSTFTRPRSVMRGQSARTLTGTATVAATSANRPKSSSTTKRVTSRITNSAATLPDTFYQEVGDDLNAFEPIQDPLPTNMGALASRRSSLAGPLRVSQQSKSTSTLQPRVADPPSSSIESSRLPTRENVLMSSSEFLAMSSLANNQSSQAVPVPPTRISGSSIATSSSRDFVAPLPPNTSSISTGPKRVAVASNNSTEDRISQSKGQADNNTSSRRSSLAGVARVPIPSKPVPLTNNILNSYADDNSNRQPAPSSPSSGSGLTTLSGRSGHHLLDAVEVGSNLSSNVNGEDSQMMVFSADNLRLLASDEYWGNRIKAFELIHRRLQLAGDDSSLISPSMIDTILDLAVEHMADPHHKIAMEAMQIIQYFIDHPSFASTTSSKLSLFIGALFHRLADRRQSIRDQANHLLNSIRQAYDPIAIISALAPRIMDIPARIRTAVMQFLGAIVPYCESYFTITSNTATFLSRMTILLSGSGANKPSVTLTVAGRRLLELVYKVAPREVCLQLALLPLQQQHTLKKLLEVTVPDIDAIVTRYATSVHTGANTSSYSNNRQVKLRSDHQVPPIQVHEDEVKPVGSVQQRSKEIVPVTATIFPKDSTSDDILLSSSTAVGRNEVDFYAEAKDKDNKLPPYHSSANKENIMSPARSISTSPSKLSSPSSKLSPLKPTLVTKPLFPASPLARELSTDIVVLLESLHPTSTTDDKLQAIHMLRKFMKEEAKEEFWKQYTSQIISVLLESFQPPRSMIAMDSPTRRNQERPLTGLSPRAGSSTKDSENMHLACKALSLLVKYEGHHVKNFMDLLVTRLCQAAAYTPVTVTLNCEQILSEIAGFDAEKFLGLVIPFAATLPYHDSQAYPTYNPSNSPFKKTLLHQEDTMHKAQVRLIALHTMAVAIKHSSSPHLLERLSVMVATIIPSISSSLADLRKAVIMVLVEVYFVIGDALYPYVQDLAAPHRKLLTIYVDKMSEQRQVCRRVA